MAGEEKAEVDGAVKRREVVLNTDWLTATFAVLGIVFLLFVTARSCWRLAEGDFVLHVGHRGTLAYISLICAAGLSLWFAAKVEDRLLRFAFGLMAIPMCADVIVGVLVHRPLAVAVAFPLYLMRLAAFLLFLVFSFCWFKNKVKVQ